jgi:hypothetical protein
VVFEKVNQVAQAPFVASVGQGFGERRGLFPTARTAGLPLFIGHGCGSRQALAADPTKAAFYRLDGSKTILTDGKTRNPDERSTTEATIRREEGGEKAFRSRAHPGNERRFSNLGPGSPS